MYDIFVGRQPIYNPRLEIFGYELFFREHEVGQADFDDPSEASYRVMLNSLLEMGLDQLVGKNKAFFNVTPDVLNQTLLQALNPKQVVLELSNHAELNEETLALLDKVHAQGFTLALDNYVYASSTRNAVNLAQIIKLNVSELNETELRNQMKILRQYNVKVIAEKLETHEQYELCHSLKFDFYQGYFLTYPNILCGKRLPTNRLTILQLMSKLQNPNIKVKEVEELISKDISLAYRLMRYINSAYFALPEPVESIHRAVVMVGLERIRQWVSLLALSKLDDKPHDLLITSLARAKMCELLAAEINAENIGSYFMVGMFSLLDVVMDTPMEELIQTLPTTDEIKDALLKREGRMGEVLKCAIAYERSDWDQVILGDLDNQIIISCYLKAIEWAGDLGAELLIA